MRTAAVIAIVLAWVGSASAQTAEGVYERAKRHAGRAVEEAGDCCPSERKFLDAEVAQLERAWVDMGKPVADGRTGDLIGAEFDRAIENVDRAADGLWDTADAHRRNRRIKLGVAIAAVLALGFGAFVWRRRSRRS